MSELTGTGPFMVVAFFVLLAVTALLILLVLLVLFVSVALAVPSDAAVEFAIRRMCSLGTAQRELTFAFCATITKHMVRMRICESCGLSPECICS